MPGKNIGYSFSFTPSKKGWGGTVINQILCRWLQLVLINWRYGSTSRVYFYLEQFKNFNHELIIVKEYLTFPVVCWYKLKNWRSSSSLAAPGLSILLPRMSTGQLLRVSSVSKESSSALDSGKRARSHASTRNTIASTAGK